MAHDDATQSPFTRPGFIAAAAVVALLVIAGLTLVIINATRADDDQTAPPPATTTSAAAPAPTSEEPSTAAPAKESDSVCGLEDGDQQLPVIGPEAMWAYQGTTAYPTSEEYGPGADDPAGFRYCFQHSPLGALFFAANAITQGSDSEMNDEWRDYTVANGPFREDLLAQGGDDNGGSDSETRLNLQGFRVLSFEESTAEVDLGVRVAVGGQVTYISSVYELVWQDGDWKVSAESLEPISFTAIPDLVGYIQWGE